MFLSRLEQGEFGCRTNYEGSSQTELRLLVIPRVLPAQQNRAVLLGTVHELCKKCQISVPGLVGDEQPEFLTKNHMLAPNAVAVKR